MQKTGVNSFLSVNQSNKKNSRIQVMITIVGFEYVLFSFLENTGAGILQ
jgi:hypothetical protein